MKFERHKNPKDSMNVGLKTKALDIFSCSVKFRINKEDKENTQGIFPEDIIPFIEMWQKDLFPPKKIWRILNLRGFWKGLTSIQILEVHFRIKADPMHDEEGALLLGGDRIGIVRGKGDDIIIISCQGKFYELEGTRYYTYYLF